MLTDNTWDGLAYVRAHPSLVIVEPEDGAEVLASAGVVARDMPILLRVTEPDFVRRFEAKLRQRVEALGVSRVAVIALTVQDAGELKSGGLLQVMFSMREAGLFDHVALATDQVNTAEWLSGNSAIHGLMLPYGLEDQSARYRTIPLMKQMIQAAAALRVVPHDDDAAAAFAWGDSERVLPVMDRPWPEHVTPWTAQEVERAWEDYQQAHQPPEPLPRSRPPE
jgi:hypothetical protein